MKMEDEKFWLQRFGFSIQEDSVMKMNDVREIAKKRGVRAGKLGKTELIRTIQRSEGNYDCHATSHVQECNQTNCLWRPDCMDAVQSA